MVYLLSSDGRVLLLLLNIEVVLEGKDKADHGDAHDGKLEVGCGDVAEQREGDELLESMTLIIMAKPMAGSMPPATDRPLVSQAGIMPTRVWSRGMA